MNLSTLIHFTACGLVFDAIGVLLLGFAFFFKSKEAISLESGTYWDRNPHLLKSLLASKFDGILGTFYLFIGFVFQVLGYADIQHEISTVSAYGLLLLSLGIYFGGFRKRKVQEWESAISLDEPKD